MNQSNVDMKAILDLADCYCSPVLFCELEVRVLDFLASDWQFPPPYKYHSYLLTAQFSQIF